MKLADIIRIAPQFQRAVRVDLDFGRPESLAGYVFQSSARAALEGMATQFANGAVGAFTLTGPYGGGKSYLALLLASRLAGEKAVREIAKNKFGAALDSRIAHAFRVNGKRWQYLPVVGSRNDLTSTLWHELERKRLIKKRPPRNADSGALAETLVGLAEQTAQAGLLVVVDELGKHLESAAREGDDIYVLQQIAEAANRSNRRLIFVGILHQAFDQYASRLGREVRDEWAKIQGRFTDVPVLVPVDEVIELVGRAIVNETPTLERTKSSALRIVAEIRRNRPGYSEDIWQRLAKCWPLHPATAALLGPVSRRRFSQNERSVFSFLSSAEPLGFAEFTRTTDVAAASTFTLSSYWDYLRANLEPSILASPDGHRWAQAAEAVNKAEAKGDVAHIAVTKTVALIDLFKNGSGLNASTDVVATCLEDVSERIVSKTLEELQQWGILAYRKHSNSWVIHEGSDFDIDAAVTSVLASGIDFELGRVAALANLQPILAKRLYHDRGTLRWFFTEIARLEDVKYRVQEFDGNDGAAGKFVLAIPDRHASVRAAKAAARDASTLCAAYPVAVGVAQNVERMRDLGLELLALEGLDRRFPEIAGDRVARREIAARVSAVSAILEEELRAAFVDSEWYVHGASYRIGPDGGLSQLASQLGAGCFSQAPKINSELVNRQKPSSNSQAAVRLLMRAMASKSVSPQLGLDGFSAERGLYETVLGSTGLHVVGSDRVGRFSRPSKGDKAGLWPLWNCADKLVKANSEGISFADLYAEWERPPFGVRRGLLPILSLAYVLSNPTSVSVYREGMYQPEINEVFADTLLQDAAVVSLRWFQNDREEGEILRSIAEVVRATIAPAVEDEPLLVSKALVRFALGLPKWTHRTAQLSSAAVNLVKLLLHASDPKRLLFVDLPAAIGTREADKLSSVLRDSIGELAKAYESALAGIRIKLLESLRTDPKLSFKERSEVVHGISGDLVLDAFALRIASIENGIGDMEGLISLVTNRPPREWTDRDLDLATIELARLAMRFRQVELLASVQGRSASREAVAVAIALPNGSAAKLRAVDLSREERKSVQRMAAELREFLLQRSADTELCIAAMAEAAFTFVDATEHETD